MDLDTFSSRISLKQLIIFDALYQFIGTYGLDLKIRYKIPFFFKKSWICYLNPVKNDKIELVFVRGNELREKSLLSFRNRKQVGGIICGSVEEISFEVIDQILISAIALDEKVKYSVKKMILNSPVL